MNKSTEHPHQKHLDEIDAVRAWIVENPDVPVDLRIYPGVSNLYFAPKDVPEIREQYRAVAKALTRTGRVEKFTSDEDKSYATAGVKVPITENTDYVWKVARDSVCSKQLVTKEVEEWVCDPVLAEVEA